jgi:hypothetical protein
MSLFRAEALPGDRGASRLTSKVMARDLMVRAVISDVFINEVEPSGSRYSPPSVGDRLSVQYAVVACLTV